MRLQRLVVKMLNAAFDYPDVVSSIGVSRRMEDLRELRVRFGNATELARAPSIAWVCQHSLNALMTGEAIISGNDQRALIVSDDGVPSVTSLEDVCARALISVEPSELVFFVRCSDHLDPDALVAALVERSWIGSPIAQLPETSGIELIVGAGRHLIKPEPFLVIAHVLINGRCYYAYRTGVVLDTVRIRCLPGNEEPEVMRIPVNALADALKIDLALQYGIKAKTDIMFDVWSPNRISSVQFIGDVIEAPLTAALKAGLTADLEFQRNTNVSELEVRVREIVTRPTVKFFVSDINTIAALIPTNEMETVILAGKLEARIAREFNGDFCIVSYTGRKGIDSLCRIRRNAWQNPIIVPVEFEFQLSNFFAHQHPLEQCEFIICWTSKDLKDGTYSFGQNGLGQGGLEFEISSVSWKRIIRYKGHQIIVLPLESLVV